MKRYLSTLITAFLFWIILNTLFFVEITHLAINRNNMLYIHLFNICVCLLCGFLIGWFSKTKGWLLGLILGIITIIILPIFTLFTSDF